MRRLSSPLRLFACTLACATAALAQQPQHRPPAVPLITHNPYFSVWSDHDKLTDGSTTHWTGSRQEFDSIVRVDGKPYRIMGGGPREVPAMPQTSLKLSATHTDYTFAGAGVQVELSFFAPTFPGDMDLLSEPLSYITWTVKSTDGGAHKVDVMLDVSPMIAVNTEEEAATWGRAQTASLDVLNTGSRDQRVLDKKGDNLRIDWGYFHLAVPKSENAQTVAANGVRQFVEKGTLPTSDDMEMPLAPRDGAAHLEALLHLGSVGASPVSQHVTVSYTEGFAIEFLYQRLRPYWQRNGESVADMLDKAEQQYTTLEARGRKFDQNLQTDLTQAGGADYAYLATLAYQQSLAACQLTADIHGTPLYFSKENFSNGSVGTVDVNFPASPILLFFNPALLRAELIPILRFAMLPVWPFPFAPHDVGTYPLANGQTYGGGTASIENQMPVEESGDMIIMADGIAQMQDNLDMQRQYWPLFTKWAEYLRKEGFDPGNQLSTDDFAGHLAHNVNLSVKAIVALGAYADMAKRLGHADTARDYRAAAEGMAKQWQAKAKEGDHTLLAFDKPGTWSQKYNLVWDRILGLDLFPPKVKNDEVSFYIKKLNKYGFPLDNRKTYTKLDWELWSATMAPNHEEFEQLMKPLVTWADDGPTRVPLTDWYDTITGKQVGFQARSVVGGLFVKALADKSIAKKWRDMAQQTASDK